MTSAPRPDSIEGLFARFGPSYRWLVTATVMMGTIATILTATIVNVALNNFPISTYCIEAQR